MLKLEFYCKTDFVPHKTHFFSIFMQICWTKTYFCMLRSHFLSIFWISCLKNMGNIRILVKKLVKILWKLLKLNSKMTKLVVKKLKLVENSKMQKLPSPAFPLQALGLVSNINSFCVSGGRYACIFKKHETFPLHPKSGSGKEIDSTIRNSKVINKNIMVRR